MLSEVSDAADSPLLLPFLPSLSHTLGPPPPPFPLQVSDADDSDIISKSGEEEDRNVGKLLMFLGSNVTNRRERDARMQRCLQESGNEKAPGQEQRKKLEMSRKMRLSSGKEGGEGDVEQLHGFWSALPAERRQMLCRVGAMEAEGAILSKEKEALKEKEKEEKKRRRKVEAMEGRRQQQEQRRRRRRRGQACRRQPVNAAAPSEFNALVRADDRRI